jgi:hypothetical protein
MIKCISAVLNQLLAVLILLSASAAVTIQAEEDWRKDGQHLRLINLLDREDGYCIDVLGVGNRVMLDMPLITHNCKYRDYADEAVVHRKDGTLYFPAYGGCVTVMGLNNHALPYNNLMLKQCNIDQGFLKATKFQKFTLNKNQQVQLNGTSLRLMAGNQSEETFNSTHRWRSLYMQDCAIAEQPLSQWHFVKP